MAADSSEWLSIIYLEVVNRGCSNAFCINPFHLSRHQIFNYLQNPTAAAFTEFEHYWHLNPVLHPAISQLIWNVGLWELHCGWFSHFWTSCSKKTKSELFSSISQVLFQQTHYNETRLMKHNSSNTVGETQLKWEILKHIALGDFSGAWFHLSL